MTTQPDKSDTAKPKTKGANSAFNIPAPTTTSLPHLGVLGPGPGTPATCGSISGHFSGRRVQLKAGIATLDACTIFHPCTSSIACSEMCC